MRLRNSVERSPGLSGNRSTVLSAPGNPAPKRKAPRRFRLARRPPRRRRSKLFVALFSLAAPVPHAIRHAGYEFTPPHQKPSPKRIGAPGSESAFFAKNRARLPDSSYASLIVKSRTPDAAEIFVGAI